MIAAPAALALLSLAHPAFSTRALSEPARISAHPQWLPVHIGMLLAVGILDLMLLSLTGPQHGRWRHLVWLGAGMNVVLYSAFLGVDGLGGGLLVAAASAPGTDAAGLSAAVTVLFAAPLVALLARLGGAGWLLAVLGLTGAAGNAGRSVAFGLVAATGALSLEFSHAPPFGVAGAALLAVGMAGLLPALRSSGPRPESPLSAAAGRAE